MPVTRAHLKAERQQACVWRVHTNVMKDTTSSNFTPRGQSQISSLCITDSNKLMIELD